MQTEVFAFKNLHLFAKICIIIVIKYDKFCTKKIWPFFFFFFFFFLYLYFNHTCQSKKLVSSGVGDNAS